MRDIIEIIKEIKEQKKYYTNEQSRLKYKISKLPKGSIQKRIVKGHPYYYLLSRVRGEIVQEYLGSSIPPILQKQVSKRQDLEKELKTVNEQLKILRKFKI